MAITRGRSSAITPRACTHAAGTKLGASPSIIAAHGSAGRAPTHAPTTAKFAQSPSLGELARPGAPNPTPGELLGVDPSDPPTLYHPGEGPNGGFSGRTGIYELIAVDDAMRSMIHEGVSEQDLERHARTMGPSIRADGRRRVLEGSTTIEELLRVTRED